ncbi:mitochondrial proton/calcium exchanger protein-like isoform X1 [Gordionus sp. m RMFG-2023]|uniref:mitochondrial proton/calcium exchanger protein-like isoform X1 n=2 Tax=Gordionus sp. m RMFG-2023 TaxID=3053472 RepID=UPI0031FC689F
MWEKVKHEILHYYHGFRLLGLEIKVSSGLLWQVLNGHTLTRRERKQFLRTVSDLFRLIPFLVFIIVPFMEFLLPVAIKLFPNMLPSTFNTDPSAEKLQKQLKARLEIAKFLQETITETALQYKDDKKHPTENVNSFLEFMEKVRKGDKSPTNDEIIKFSRLFEDEFTLDTLNRDQLVAMCKLLQLKPIGNNYLLRFQLNTALRSLKQDDILIRNEGGVDNLTIWELQAACRARGMRALGLSEQRLKQQLTNWLQLHLDSDIPASLLLLSRTLMGIEDTPSTPSVDRMGELVDMPFKTESVGTTGKLKPISVAEEEDRQSNMLKKTLASLPKAAEEQANLRAAEIEGIRVDPKTLAEVIKKEAAAIKEEKAEKMKDKFKKEDVMVDKAPTLKDTAKLFTEPKLISAEDKSSKEDITPQELQDIVKAVETISDKREIDKDIKQAKEIVKDIKENLQEYKEDIEEAKTLVEEIKGADDLKESKSAIRLTNSLNKMLGKADKIVEKLEIEKKHIDTIEEKNHKFYATELKDDLMISEKDKDEKAKMISIPDLVNAIKKSRQIHMDDSRLKNLAAMFDEDKDGNVNMEHVLEAIEMIAREDVNLDKKQIMDIVKMLKKEDKLEEQQKAPDSAAQPKKIE